MKCNLFLLLFLAANILFYSCDKDENRNLPADDKEKELFIFTYKDQLYSSECYYEDEELIILDNRVREVYAELNELPELATVIDEEGNISYYDTYEESYKDVISPLSTRSSHPTNFNYYELTLYVDSNFKGSYKKLTEHIQGTNGYWWPCEDLKFPDVNLNNKISSFKFMVVSNYKATPGTYKSGATIADLVFYEKEYLSGKSLSYRITKFMLMDIPGTQGYEISYKKLKGVSYGFLKTWNDRISSFGIRFW